MLYNIPGRSIVEISVETMAKLAEIPNIVGVKDATGNLSRASRDTRYVGTADESANGLPRSSAFTKTHRVGKSSARFASALASNWRWGPPRSR